MLKRRALMLLGLCFAVPAQAGLFDDDALKQIQQVEVRVLKLEEADKHLNQSISDLQEFNKRLTQSILDLQGQIDTSNGEIRKLRGQNEELAHGLQDAEKREKDFYVDLDTRLRHFESMETAAASKPVVAPVSAVESDDMGVENRAIEMAYSLFKNGSYADAVKSLHEFLKKYPDSVHVPNASFWLGNAQLALKDYKNALATYQWLLEAEPNTAKAADVLFDIAACQRGLKLVPAANKTLKQLIAKYPGSAAATKAKNLIAGSK